MGSVRLIQSDSGHLYYTVTNKSTTASIIVEVYLSFDEKYLSWSMSKRDIFSANTGRFAVLQLNRTEQQLQSKNYLYKGTMEESSPDEETNVLYALCTDMNLYKIKQRARLQYTLLQKVPLNHIDEILGALNELSGSQFETMSITDRTLTFRDKIHSIGSGRTFNAVSHKLVQGRDIVDS